MDDDRMLLREQGNYNEVLHDLAENKQFPITLADITAIKDIRTRAICALLMVRIPKRQIARLMHLSRTTFYRIIIKMVHRKLPLSLKKSME
jgi:hypothetical protein